jgi:hypothetical protein
VYCYFAEAIYEDLWGRWVGISKRGRMEERVYEDEYGTNTVYTCMQMEK